ncbi:hypothetical protein AB0F52_33205 [Amycolatopsis sp. NPDC024027]|uniref:hypothetical protein n=1 Tax=Amycolatopsis sp. NPDC024027 TaxID=3154327 RepID=UPI0033F65060
MKDEYAHPRWGTEFDWLAVDPSGSLAVLTSAGYGPVPKAVRDHVESVDAALGLINTWPYVGGSISRPSDTGDYADWRDLAARGFYAYDWKDSSGPYARLAVPTTPLTVDNLTDEWITQMVVLARFTVDFASATQLNLADLADLADRTA